MLTIFGSLALWFRISRNGAIIIGIILVIFASLAFFLAMYRTLFFRVLIDKDGFFYQTAPGNGRYYHYYTIRQIWVSSGNDANAQQMQYCNFETQDGRTMRFFFRNLDWDAVDYLIAQVENTEEQAQRSDGDLMISGRVQGGVRLVAAVCILAAVLFAINASCVGSAEAMPFYLITAGDLVRLVWMHPAWPFTNMESVLANGIFLLGGGLLPAGLLFLKQGFWRRK